VIWARSGLVIPRIARNDPMAFAGVTSEGVVLTAVDGAGSLVSYRQASVWASQGALREPMQRCVGFLLHGFTLAKSLQLL
jgi:hypothetical protein